MSTRTTAGRMQAFPTTQIPSTRWLLHFSHWIWNLMFDILPHDASHHSSVWPIKHLFWPLFRNCILGSSTSSELTLKPFPALLERRSSSSRWSKSEDSYIMTAHLLWGDVWVYWRCHTVAWLPHLSRFPSWLLSRRQFWGGEDSFLNQSTQFICM